MTNPLVSIIILHWRQPQWTKNCLQSVRQLDYAPYQVLLVDNGSKDGFVAQLHKDFPGVETLALAENQGFAAGVNPAIRQALQKNAAYVFLLNNDVLVPPDLLTKLVAAQQQNPTIGVLTPKIVRDDRPELLAGPGVEILPYDLKLIGWNQQANTLKEQDQPVSLDAIFATAMLLPREVIEKVGLLDERFFFYYEDIDFCLRVRAAGYQAAYLPNVTVRHAVGISTQGIKGLRSFYLSRSRQLFFHKYRRGMQFFLYLLHEIGNCMRVVFVELKHGEHANALSYLAGALVGLVLATLQIDEIVKKEQKAKNVIGTISN